MANRLIAPGSEWKCWRLWYARSALGDLLGPDFQLGNKDQRYVVAKSAGRRQKEIAIRRQKLARLLWTLRGLRREKSRDRLLQRLGVARQKAGRAAGFVAVQVPAVDQPLNRDTFRFSVQQEKLAEAELYDGHYLLRSNLAAEEPAWLWKLYMQLVEIEGVFRTFKNDLKVRPIYHSLESRVEAHIFVSFLAYCLWVTLKQRLNALAPGLTPRQALDQLAGVQMLEVVLPTTDGRELTLSRYTQPESAVRLLLQQLQLNLPEQPPPRLGPAQILDLPTNLCSEDLSIQPPQK